MILPEQMIIGPLTVNTLWLFIGSGVLFYFFIIWYEARKDGFDADRMFDLTFITVIISAVFLNVINSWYQRLEVLSYDSPFLKMDRFYFAMGLSLIANIGVFVILAKKWKWSIYRVLDDFALGLNFLLLFVSAGMLIIFGDYKQIVVIFLLLLLYSRLLRFRGYRFPSGVVFSAFVYFISLLTLIFRPSGYLLFFFLLVTIGTLNLYFRRKRSMSKNLLPLDFLNLIKDKLTLKDKQLKKQQELLKNEDAYLQEGRTEGNSEIIDEAILEDSQKEITDAKMSAVKSMRIQVRRAMAFLRLGKYGICEVCGKPIDKARLEFYPEATRCIDCAEK